MLSNKRSRLRLRLYAMLAGLVAMRKSEHVTADGIGHDAVLVLQCGVSIAVTIAGR